MRVSENIWEPAGPLKAGAYWVASGIEHDRRHRDEYRARMVEGLPPDIQEHIYKLAAELEKAGDVPGANKLFGASSAHLRAIDFSYANNEQKLRDRAKLIARNCGRARTLEQVARTLSCYGLEPCAMRGVTADGKMQRAREPRWVMAQLRKTISRSTEDIKRSIGMVRRGRGIYCTDVSLRQHHTQQSAQADWIANMQAVSASGKLLPLAQVRNASLANPKNRRTELMVRMRLFDDWAKMQRHQALFATLTCPSAFHPQLSAGGNNEKYNGSTVRDAQEWMCQMWARFRAKCARLSIPMYGFRVTEPHHDGTPHWHLLLYMPARHLDTVKFLLRARWLSEYSDETGAPAARVKFEEKDPAKGSAVGYMGKYIAKGIDGYGKISTENDHESGEPVNQSIERIIAWARRHGTRQFQQIGGNPVGLWRELRRIGEPVADPDIERARSASRDCRLVEYASAVGGVESGRHTNIQLAKVETGDRNHYGEPSPPRIVGVKCTSRIVITRHERWQLKRITTALKSATTAADRKAAATASREAIEKLESEISALSDLGPVSLTVRAAGDPLAWTNPNETSMYGPH